jgi:flavin-dependent dehydrogenase
MTKVKDIVIVGGGSAGWMTASTIIKQLKDVNVTVIESENVPIVGVGESTVGGIRRWMRMVGINDADFVKETNASYKLAIKFNDFYEKGNTWYYPFGGPYLDENFFGRNDWFVKKTLLPDTPEWDLTDCYYPQMALVNQNKLCENNGHLGDYKFTEDSAFHFDATKFGKWLKDHICIPNNVSHIVADVTDVNTIDNSISSLTLSNGKIITADLFVDCTGFKSLLLGKSLKEPFVSYENILPNNRAWAARIPYVDKHKELQSVTECTAIDNGWVWNIPLWDRIGTGYVYSDKYSSPENALQEFKTYLESKGHTTEDVEFRDIKMRVGRHERLWVNNVVAVGLSAAFIEPLESTGLVTVYEFAINLCRSLRRGSYSQWDIDEYNHMSIDQFNYWAQFVAMHYALSHRDDTKYWRDISKKSLLSEVQNLGPLQKQSVFHQSIWKKGFEWRLQDNNGLMCLASGMNWYPIDEIIINGFNKELHTDYLHFDQMIENLNYRKEKWNDSIKNAPSLHDYLYYNFYKD